MNIVSLITARGGSKGIPRKNIKLLNNKPLIAYSIEESVASNTISKTYVTTEDREISEISKQYGAEIIKRPDELAQDDSSSVDVAIHALDYLSECGIEIDFFVLLQPTSPLRTKEDIDNAIDLFIKNDCGAVISVCELDHSSMMSFKVEDNFLSPSCGEQFINIRRQELPTFYCQNGAIYITTPESIRKYRTFIPEKTIPYVMPEERSVDVDTELDLKFIEFLLNEK